MSELALFKGNSNSAPGGGNAPQRRSALLKQRPEAGYDQGEGDLSEFVPTNLVATKVSADRGSGRIFRGRGAAPVPPAQAASSSGETGGEFQPQAAPAPQQAAGGKIFGYRHTDTQEHKLPPLSTNSIAVPTGDPPPPGAKAAPAPVVQTVDKKIIEAAEAKAKEIVAAAQQQVKQVAQQAQDQLKKLNEKAMADAAAAKQAAFEQGTAEGIEAGKKIAHQEYVDLMLKARDLYVQAIKERQKLIADTEPALAKLSVGIAEKIIGLEVTTDNDVIMGVVKQALGDLKDREQVRIRVNPDDYHIVNNDRASLMRMVEGLKDFELAIDSKVARGGCIIETNLGNIDARLETQLSAIATAFERSEKGEADDASSAT